MACEKSDSRVQFKESMNGLRSAYYWTMPQWISEEMPHLLQKAGKVKNVGNLMETITVVKVIPYKPVYLNGQLTQDQGISVDCTTFECYLEGIKRLSIIAPSLKNGDKEIELFINREVITLKRGYEVSVDVFRLWLSDFAKAINKPWSYRNKR